MRQPSLRWSVEASRLVTATSPVSFPIGVVIGGRYDGSVATVALKMRSLEADVADGTLNVQVAVDDLLKKIIP